MTFILLATGCADVDAPTWPATAEATAAGVKSDGITFKWPEAEDNRAVVRYEIYRSGDEKIGQVDFGGTYKFEIKDLTDFTEYMFWVEAVDEAGNNSLPLTLEVKTPDATPPRWKEGSEGGGLSLSLGQSAKENEQAVLVTWGEAEDNDHVLAYRLKKGEKTVASIPGGKKNEYLLEGKEVEGNYMVEACDHQGNCLASEPVRVVLSALQARAMQLGSAPSAGMLGLLSENKTPSLMGIADDAASGAASGGLGLSGIGGSFGKNPTKLELNLDMKGKAQEAKGE